MRCQARVDKEVIELQCLREWTSWVFGAKGKFTRERRAWRVCTQHHEKVLRHCGRNEIPEKEIGAKLIYSEFLGEVVRSEGV